MVWFETILVVLTLLTGVIWLLDKLFFAKKRAEKSGLLDENKDPVIVDYSKSFFPVLAVVLILRSFVAEPFKIPSASMMPNLLIGDFIVVNKFSYGLRLPITNTKILSIGEPKRGDVVVFNPPFDPDKNWIKRIIGLPGDTISFSGNTLSINGEPVQYKALGTYQGRGLPPGSNKVELLQEDLPGKTHTIYEDLDAPRGAGAWIVPAGNYFVMGDNRDNSEDSRFWRGGHFLPETALRGKAFMIWLNCEGFLCKDGFIPSRIGDGIN